MTVDALARRILIASNDPPQLAEHYCTARNSVELQNILRQHADSLQLAVVFSDFELNPEDAEQILKTLPYVVVDPERTDNPPIMAPGIGRLLGEMSYFDRVTLPCDARWAEWQAQHQLPPLNREPWPGYGQSGVLDEILSFEALQTDAGGDSPSDQTPGIAASSKRGEVNLRRLKQEHLAEVSLVLGFLAELTKDMPNPSDLRLVEFLPGSGRWCHALRNRFRIAAVSREDHSLNGLRNDFPGLEICTIAGLPGGLRHPDVLFASDALNTGSSDDCAQLSTLLALAGKGTRLLLLEDFGSYSDESDDNSRLTIKAFEERLWEQSEGLLLLDRCEIVRYRHPDSPRTRALLQLRQLSS